MQNVSPVTTVFCSEPYNESWDNFVAACDGDIQQTSAWAKINAPHNNALRFYLLGEQGILAGGQLTLQTFPVLGKIGVIKEGPCFKINTKEIHETFCNEAIKIAKKEKLKYLAIIPSYKTTGLTDCLTKHGFKPKPNQLPPNPTVRSTLVLDLRQPLESLLHQMKKGRRKSIQKGLTFPISFQVGKRDDLELFYNLMLDTCKRRNTQPMVKSLDHVYNIWDCLHPHGLIVLHLGVVENKTICASLGLTCGKTYKNWFWGWNGEYAHYNISDTIDWRSIEWAKQEGFHHYDFVHVDQISADAIESDAPVPEHIKRRTHYGSTFYKMQFGGRLVHYPDIYCYFPNKLYFLTFCLLCRFEKFSTNAKKIILHTTKLLKGQKELAY